LSTEGFRTSAPVWLPMVDRPERLRGIWASDVVVDDLTGAAEGAMRPLLVSQVVFRRPSRHRLTGRASACAHHCGR
jgi:hypothetical protein